MLIKHIEWGLYIINIPNDYKKYPTKRGQVSYNENKYLNTLEIICYNKKLIAKE